MADESSELEILGDLAPSGNESSNEEYQRELKSDCKFFAQLMNKV
jgi:hypothetical protein